MSKREAERQTHQMDTLRALGFTREEAEQLRRISMTLQRWYEKECGNEYGCIERDEKTGRPHWLTANTGRRSHYPMADLEAGALKRLRRIIDRRNDAVLMSGAPIDVTNPPLLRTYVQTDPRGAALYIIRPGDVPAGATVDSCYSRGICVY